MLAFIVIKLLFYIVYYFFQEPSDNCAHILNYISNTYLGLIRLEGGLDAANALTMAHHVI